ncbi:MAG: helix-turn-helix transcriptional regulator [bacterium]|nr:helix-turn-helix transcriptional regulator [bacterium]
MDQKKIGNFIRELRKKNHLTQKELADQYHITYQAVSKWENGKNLPDMSLVRKMSQDFNINMEDMLDGNYNQKKKNYRGKILLIIMIPLIILGSIVICLFLKDQANQDFQFKILSSSCSDFNISGSISYNDNKSSIYISDITYCGGNDTTEYQKIECNLYESHNDIEVKIGGCNYKNDQNITLEDYLHHINFTVDNYKKICNDYSNKSLYLQINATDHNDKTTMYKIPLILQDNCN